MSVEIKTEYEKRTIAGRNRAVRPFRALSLGGLDLVFLETLQQLPE